MSKLKGFLKKVRREYEESVVKAIGLIRLAGEHVSEEQEEKRKEVCDGCEYSGEVEPMPGVIREGCKVCGCPFETKRVMRNLVGKKIICPHPEGDKWVDVDNKFKYYE